VWVDGRTSTRANSALWAIEVSTTDRRWLTLDEMVTSWVSGLLPGDALAGHDGGPWRQRIRDLPEVRARLANELAIPESDAHPLPLVRRKRSEAPSGGAEPSSARTIVEALTRYAEERRAPYAPRVETLAPSSVVGVARDADDPPRSWMNLLGVGAATVAAATGIFLWRAREVDTPAASAVNRPVSFGAGAPSRTPASMQPALSASASAPDPSGSAARLHAPAPVERRNR
jgi:hypothetical protein